MVDGQPEGWLDNEPDYAPDPEAEMPSDWDEEEDGQWEAPMVANPKVKQASMQGSHVAETSPNSFHINDDNDNNRLVGPALSSV